MNFEFMTIDTPLPPCMPFPRALTGFPVSSTAKVMYCRMLDAMLSKGQEDENGMATRSERSLRFFLSSAFFSSIWACVSS